MVCPSVGATSDNYTFEIHKGHFIKTTTSLIEGQKTCSRKMPQEPSQYPKKSASTKRSKSPPKKTKNSAFFFSIPPNPTTSSTTKKKPSVLEDFFGSFLFCSWCALHGHRHGFSLSCCATQAPQEALGTLASLLGLQSAVRHDVQGRLVTQSTFFGQVPGTWFWGEDGRCCCCCWCLSCHDVVVWSCSCSDCLRC